MTPDVTYVSSNFDNPELKKVMPWTGTHKGPQALSEVFAAIQRFWKTLDFKVTDTIRMPWRRMLIDLGARYARGTWFTARMLEKGTSRL
jgi:hypothetical protein